MVRFFLQPLSVRQMRLLCASLLAGFALCGALQGLCWGRTQLDAGAALCADTLRLHIRAASDAVADQSAKLRVRDAVLACLDAACPAGNQTDARSWAARNLFTLQLAARHALARCGVDAPVQVQLVNMYFPARQYTGGCLPAGRYDAVRIDIGSGGGRNWWCVLYPGLCSFAQGGYALPAENDLVCGQYILRFRLVDWAHRLTARRQTVLLAG